MCFYLLTSRPGNVFCSKPSDFTEHSSSVLAPCLFASLFLLSFVCFSFFLLFSLCQLFCEVLQLFFLCVWKTPFKRVFSLSFLFIVPSRLLFLCPSYTCIPFYHSPLNKLFLPFSTIQTNLCCLCSAFSFSPLILSRPWIQPSVPYSLPQSFKRYDS